MSSNKPYIYFLQTKYYDCNQPVVIYFYLHDKFMEIFTAYHLKLVIGISFGKSSGQPHLFFRIPFEFKSKQFIVPLLNIINFLLPCSAPKP